MIDAGRANNHREVCDTRMGFDEKPAFIVIDFVN